MGAFNLLSAEAACPNCKNRAMFEVQFKYGNMKQNRYVLGQKVEWGGNDRGKPGYPRVRVEAIGGPCIHCGYDNLEFDILIEDDRLMALVPVGLIRENESKEGYVVEDEPRSNLY